MVFSNLDSSFPLPPPMIPDVRLLVLEDDPKIASFVVKGFNRTDSPWTTPRTAEAGAVSGGDDEL